MKRILGPLILFAMLASLAWGSVKTWPQLAIRSQPLQFDRGVVTAVMHDTAGAHYTVIVRRKWMTGTNARIRAFPSIYTGADTAGQGIDLTYDGGNRYAWHIPNPATMAYQYYEIGGAGGDSLISPSYTDWPMLGLTAPTSFIDDSLAFAAAAKVPRVSIPATFGPGGSGSQIIQGILTATGAVSTPAIIPYTGGAFTPTNKSGRVRFGSDVEIMSNNLILRPYTNTNPVTIAMADSATGYRWYLSPQSLSASWSMYPTGGAGSTYDLWTNMGSSLAGWQSISTITDAVGLNNLTDTGNTTLGNATGDSLKIQSSVRAVYPIKMQSTLTVNGAQTNKGAIDALGTITSGSAAVAGSFKIYDGSSNYSTVGFPSASTNPTFNLPTDNGTSNYVLKTDGSGNTSWANLATLGIWSGSAVMASSSTETVVIVSGVNRTNTHVTANWDATVTAINCTHITVYVGVADTLAFDTSSKTTNRTFHWIAVGK